MTAMAAVAVVLGSGTVSFVDTAAATVVERVALPGEGAALFVAPDGRVVVPLMADDATVIVQPHGRSERWDGRVFPLFFDEFDRMYVITSGALAALSYPERVPLFSRELTGVSGAWRAGCSADGRIVALVSAADRRRITILSARERTQTRNGSLAAAALAVAVSPDGRWIAVAEEGGTIEVLDSALPQAAAVSVGGEIVAMALAPDGQSLIVATSESGAGRLVGLRVRGAAKPPKQRFVRPLAEAPVGLALADDEAVVVTRGSLLVFGKLGRKLLRRIELEGGRAVAVLPAQVTSAVPEWGDERER